MVVGAAGGVADDAQAEEGHLGQVAGLGYGGALHVAGQAIDEVALYGVLPLTVGDELVAGTDEAGNQPLVRAVLDGERMVEEVLVGVVAGGQPLHLAKGADASRGDASTVYIMVDTLGGCQNVAYSHLRVDTAGQAGAEDGIGVVLLDEAHGTHGGIHLADAALPKHYLVISQTTAVASYGIVHLPILDVHRYNNSYLHVLLVSIFVSVFYRAKIVLFSLMDALDIIFLFNKRYDKQLQ